MHGDVDQLKLRRLDGIRARQAWSKQVLRRSKGVSHAASRLPSGDVKPIPAWPANANGFPCLRWWVGRGEDIAKK